MICINQDVPTCFYAVQRSHLPIIVMLLDRGLSDTNRGEVNQDNYIKEEVFHKYFVLARREGSYVSCMSSSLAFSIGRRTVVNLRAIHPTLLRVRRGASYYFS